MVSKLTNDNEHKSIESSVKSIADDLVRNLALSIKQSKKIASGKLIKSLMPKLSFSASVMEINILALFYAKFVDSGRKKFVKRIPVKILLKWIRQKNFTSGTTKKDLSVAFAIQESIFLNGIKPANFIQGAFDKTQRDIDKEIVDAVQKEVERGFLNIERAAA